mmetsp:Transcript_66998/g.187275  ORF Transcript_66998/g.187275 Transcript_66998/m.187275 type:complete len:304 (+) Transcript_66998:392-1303(+)
MHGVDGGLHDQARPPLQHAVGDDAEEAPGAVDADEAVGAPLVRVRKAAGTATECVPLGVEDGDADAVLVVGQVLDPEARPGGRRVDHRGAIPADAAHLLDRGALHQEELGVADLDGADRWLPPHRLLPVRLPLVGQRDLGGGDLLQGAHVQVLRDDLPGERPHLLDELLARHLGVPDAPEELGSVLLVWSRLLGLLRPMPVPADEGLEKVHLLDPSIVGVEELLQDGDVELQKALGPHHLLRVLQNERQIPLLHRLLLVCPCRSQHDARSIWGHRVVQVLVDALSKRADTIVVGTRHERHHVL